MPRYEHNPFPFSKDTVFEGTDYKLSLSFPTDYPFKPPKVKFETSCFHPNVDVYGNICLDILQVRLFVIMSFSFNVIVLIYDVFNVSNLKYILFS